jgi:CHAT domain-containing protein
VDDAITAHLMARFYQIWLDPANPVDKQTALKLAAREVRQDGGASASPRLWAPFVLYGGP